MGVDLTLLPLEGLGLNYSFSLLRVARRRELWPDIQAMPSELAGKVSCYVSRNADGDTCYGDTSEDCYGDPLRHISAGELSRLSAHEGVRDNHMNRAIWAFLTFLEPQTRIALYWS